MDIINLLSEQISNQIAAGEVIQRPSSVVKELLENAVDAGATEIKVHIKDAGRTSIIIQDNGSGMSKKDASLCFTRHATSKIHKVEDLFQLKTKGFRGEALASIASIAHVTLKTRLEKQDDTGTLIEMNGGTPTRNEECICEKGTSIEVKNIFFNVPARRSFLKSDNAEFTSIRNEFERVSLAHNETKFILTHNGNDIYNVSAGNLRKRITDIFGLKSNEKLVPIEEKTDIVTLSGFVGKPENAKKSRGEQYFFVNQRFFKHTYFHHAVSKAFEQLIPEKSHPSYFIFLEINTEKIDVNIHPTKTEINFEESKFIYTILLSSIKQALGKYNIAPSIDFDIDTSFDVPLSHKNEIPVEPEIKVDPSYNPFSTFESKKGTGTSSNKALNNQGFGKNSDAKEWEDFYAIREEKNTSQHALIEEKEEYRGNKYLIRGRYILSNVKSGILIIDTYRAQQRILYDNMMTSFVSAPLASQKLMFPLEMELNQNEIDAWNESKSLLKQFGFQFELENNGIRLESLPSCISEQTSHSCIDDVSRTLTNTEQPDKGELAHEIVSNLVHVVSKDFQIKSEHEIETFVNQLFSSPDHSFCPFGKPIMKTLTIEELTTKF
ncbi:MAG: DNA mismatch repair endonuclease MutL [Crocinitomicaceae bacterium]|tara:strand:+ start:20129 stop:21949 length:1821 start_codon:yes stop_codon:yes gene_type:complete